MRGLKMAAGLRVRIAVTLIVVLCCCSRDCVEAAATSTTTSSPVDCVNCPSWPLQPKQYTSRPKPNPGCPKETPSFCWNGGRGNFMPNVSGSDTLQVYILSVPDQHVREDVKHHKEPYVSTRYALGFHHDQSRLNITLEWYELHHPFDCTFAKEEDDDNPMWCNQGALCLSKGINSEAWDVRVKVGQISGQTFNSFSDWAERDNTTYPVVQSWTVMGLEGVLIKRPVTYFLPVDRPHWLTRALAALQKSGAKLPRSLPVSLKYMQLILYSKEPMWLPNTRLTRKAVAKFFKKYDRFNSLEEVVNSLTTYTWFIMNRTFYYHYNEYFWRLTLTGPAQIKYKYIEIPKGDN